MASVAFATPENWKRYDLDNNDLHVRNEGCDNPTTFTFAKPVPTAKSTTSSKILFSSVLATSKKATSSSIAVFSKATLSPKLSSSFRASSSSTKPPDSTTSGKTASPTGTLPSPSDFTSQQGTKWNISTVGYIYSTSMPDLSWDKGRTSVSSPPEPDFGTSAT
ncbi:uncharacterized protein RCO7_07081 [Rhynchosporium graminicola]|uniref:Uncharacterized protein n=1 Tax=Rhynchosporium graminicola TaxID=2792576 RepID=A0A1E1K002_9HELO|nr:uncharacterized protein RCO7_07081 [Rhynchosporium commune]